MSILHGMDGGDRTQSLPTPDRRSSLKKESGEAAADARTGTGPLPGVHLITERAEALRAEIWWDDSFTIGATEFRQRIRPDEMSGRAIARHILDAAGFAQLYDALKAIQEFCDDPKGSESDETLAMGLARLLPAARAAIARAEGRS
jgi:hypothetical protein